MSLFRPGARWRPCLALCALLAQPLAAAPSGDADAAAIVARALQTHPEIRAAEASVEAARARLRGAGRPLNNPELAVEAERTDIDTVRLGIHQTLDWHDKRGALESAAEAGLKVAEARLDSLRLRLRAELFDALGRVVTQREISALAKRRVNILQRFANLARHRFEAGDIDSSERGLARLALSEARMRYATRETERIAAERDFTVLAGEPLPPRARMPQAPDGALDGEIDPAALAETHPRVREALAEAWLARRRIRVADTARKADPTLGLAAGRESSENLLALSFSLPLNLRNDFRADVEAASAEALAAEQRAHQRRRALRARLRAARASYRIVDRAWRQWRGSGLGSLKQRFRLLERQWRAGEMNTSDYLIQVQQTLDTQIAGIELRGARWAAWSEWLAASGRDYP